MVDMTEVRDCIEAAFAAATDITEEVPPSLPPSVNTSPETDRTEGGTTKDAKKRGKKNAQKKCKTQCKKELRKMIEDAAHTCAKQAVVAAELVEKAPDVSSILKGIADELAMAASKLLVVAKASEIVVSPTKQTDMAELLQNGTSLRFPGHYYQASSKLGGPPSPQAQARSDSLFIERRFKNSIGDRRRRRKARQAEAAQLAQAALDAPSAAPEAGEQSPPGGGAALDAAEQGKRPRVQEAEPPPDKEQIASCGCRKAYKK